MEVIEDARLVAFDGGCNGGISRVVTLSLKLTAHELPACLVTYGHIAPESSYPVFAYESSLLAGTKPLPI